MKRSVILVCMAALLACGIHAWMNIKWKSSPPAVEDVQGDATPAAGPKAVPSARPVVVAPEQPVTPVAPVPEPAVVRRPAVAAVPMPQPVMPTEPVIPEELARQALGWVGVDPAANQVWVTAINDANMPAPARRNLIEDLNEEGFSDPRNLTLEDLPVIENRIAIIEELGPNAADEVNYAAFEEAYKDLLNMRARLVGRVPAAE